MANKIFIRENELPFQLVPLCLRQYRNGELKNIKVNISSTQNVTGNSDKNFQKSEWQQPSKLLNQPRKCEQDMPQTRYKSQER
jgi:hypothetical protein